MKIDVKVASIMSSSDELGAVRQHSGISAFASDAASCTNTLHHLPSACRAAVATLLFAKVLFCFGFGVALLIVRHASFDTALEQRISALAVPTNNTLTERAKPSARMLDFIATSATGAI
jgi:hypothetical protein